MDIIGSFVQADSPDGNTYRTGTIVARASDEAFLVRFDCMGEPGGPTAMELCHVSEMLEQTPDGLNRWRFFANADEYREWMEWIDSLSPAKVVSLVKN